MSISLPVSRQTEYLENESLVIQPVVMRADAGRGSFFRKVWMIAAKDLRIELRAKEVLGVMAAFSILAVIILGMAFDLRVPRSEMIAPGVLWGVLLFTGLLGLNRSFSAELDRHTLLALLLTPVDRSAIYLGKFVANFCFMALTALILLPVMLFIFDVNFFSPWILVTVLLGIFGYISVGTLFAALTASIRSRESMLPILLLPVLAPLFMAGLKMTELVVDARSLASFQNWLGMLVAFDLIFFTAAILVFDLIWEDV
ncbi:MAG: heme exporter protein CcmB [Caldilineaceae bacterium]|nr:heme exporter protein CcmB [Caldilineaceae bacterium]MCB0123559.1 heme exporter protein CcmB [Caldilineaceae bacterium]MCB0183460.1 heme exporter protein CcmB [Caldilineaceae bacterium]HRW05942.1 heme exporter protein CcmB [Caldilineaceae bacterium]